MVELFQPRRDKLELILGRVTKPEHVHMLQSLLGLRRQLLIIYEAAVQCTQIHQICPCEIIIHLDLGMLARHRDVLDMYRKHWGPADQALFVDEWYP